MENLITSILEIEQNAQKRLEEARQKKDKIIAAAEAASTSISFAKYVRTLPMLGSISRLQR